jgi:hypothetical protein
MLQLSYLMPFLRQKSLAGYNQHHPLQQPTLSLSAPGSASSYLPLHHGCTHFACSCSPAMTGLSFTPPSISSPSPLLLLAHPHCSHLLYKVELGDSIQKHILRLYEMKYSNLGTMNASSKLEHGTRPLACCSNLLSYSRNALIEAKASPWLATTTTPCSSLAYLVTVSPWLCFYLSTMCPFLACSCSPTRPVICSPQLVLLLLAFIASLVTFSRGRAHRHVCGKYDVWCLAWPFLGGPVICPFLLSN